VVCWPALMIRCSQCHYRASCAHFTTAFYCRSLASLYDTPRHLLVIGLRQVLFEYATHLNVTRCSGIHTLRIHDQSRRQEFSVGGIKPDTWRARGARANTGPPAGSRAAPLVSAPGGGGVRGFPPEADSSLAFRRPSDRGKFASF